MGHGLRARRRAAALVLGPLLVVGGSGTAVAQRSPAAARASGTATTAVDPGDVRAVLARRTVALRAHDERAFLATFDAGRPALVATERLLYRNLARLPLVDPGYQASAVGGPATSRRARVSLLHRFRGVDAEPAELTEVETFARRGGTVVTTAVDPVPGTPATRYAPLDQVPLAVTEQPLVTVVAAPDAGDVGALAAAAERAAADVRAVWGGRPGPSRFVVLATRDRRAVGSWFGAGGTAVRAAAITFPQVAAAHPGRYAGARVVVDLAQSSGQDLYRVLRHEFTHAIDVRLQAVPAAGAGQAYPSWVEEGLAAWVEELDVAPRDSAYLRAMRALRRYWDRGLPPPTRRGFYRDGDRGVYDYCAAASVYRYLAARWGTAAALGFYADQAAGRPAAAWARLGTGRDRFVAGWAAWVDRQLAG